MSELGDSWHDVDEEAWSLDDLVDLERVPIDQPDSPRYDAVVCRLRGSLYEHGCARQSGFLKSSAVAAMVAEVHEKLALAHHSVAEQNVYLTRGDPDLPREHPTHRLSKRSTRFLCADRIGKDSPMSILFRSNAMTEFVRRCVGRERLYRGASPLSAILVNAQQRGDTFPWHFDASEFAVSLCLRQPSAGGRFEYVANLRSSTDENLEGVVSVLDGNRERVVTIDANPGDLQLFAGRNSLHRVTEVYGADERISLLFGYADKLGVMGSPESSRALFGRAHPT